MVYFLNIVNFIRSEGVRDVLIETLWELGQRYSRFFVLNLFYLI